MNEHLRRAMAALEAGADDVRRASVHSASEVRRRLRQTTEEILQHLEEDARTPEAEADAVVDRLHRQAQDIADDLRRVERLMRQRSGQE